MFYDAVQYGQILDNIQWLLGGMGIFLLIVYVTLKIKGQDEKRDNAVPYSGGRLLQQSSISFNVSLAFLDDIALFRSSVLINWDT